MAAFIAEPIIASVGGAISPPDDYWPLIREVCDRYGVLLIVDEVVTGFGRTGKAFAVDHWGVVPDIMAMGKGISGGYAPLGAVAVRAGIRDSFREAGASLLAPVSGQRHLCMSRPVAARRALDGYRVILITR